MYDIVYSIIAHEAPDVLHNQIENIKKWNVSKNILICLHLNDYMYSVFHSNDESVIINPDHFNKRMYSVDILQAHVRNVRFLREKNINYKSFMLIASNVMFVKQFDINKHMPTIKLSEELYTVENSYIVAFNKCSAWNGWRLFGKYSQLIQICNQKKIPLVFDQNEGRLYSRELIEKIADFLEENKLLAYEYNEVIAEEIFLPSLEKYFCGNKNVEKFCKVYWDSHNFQVTVDDIHNVRNNKEENTYCVKRVNRRMNDPIRNYINNLKI